jgi:hypothetical protein
LERTIWIEQHRTDDTCDGVCVGEVYESLDCTGARDCIAVEQQNIAPCAGRDGLIVGRGEADILRIRDDSNVGILCSHCLNAAIVRVVIHNPNIRAHIAHCLVQ